VLAFLQTYVKQVAARKELAMPALIVLKQTPKGMSLLPLSEVNNGRGLRMMNSHPQSRRVGEIMDFLIVKAREFRGQRVTLPQLWTALIKQYGNDFFPDVVLLDAVRETPARLLVKGE
jgi:hypothetical protein